MSDIVSQRLLGYISALNDNDIILVTYNVRNKKDATHKGIHVHYHGILFSKKPLTNSKDLFKFNQLVYGLEKMTKLDNYQFNYYIEEIKNKEILNPQTNIMEYQTKEQGLCKFISYIYDKHYISKIVVMDTKEQHIIYKAIIKEENSNVKFNKPSRNQLIKEKSKCINIGNLVKGEYIWILKIFERGTYEKFNPI